MKQFLLLLLFVCSLSVANAQLISGTKLTGNVVGTDINGKAVDIYADLNAGKSVVLDVFATWCGPCWSFHKSGFLEELNKQLGPDGTDQIRVYGIEGDDTTPLEDLSGGGTSQGDWLTGVDYSIINSGSYNTLLKIAFFPTLYIIRPDRTVLEVGDFRGNAVVWEKALLGKAAKDVIFTTPLDSKTFCVQSILNQKPKVINLGTTAIAGVELDVIVDGVSKLSNLSKAIGVFEEAELSIGTTTITKSSEIEIKIESLDGVADEADDNSSLSAKFIKPLVRKKDFIVRFTTDFYPEETSWKLKDGSKTLLDIKYSGTGNGGGDDANKVFEYPVSLLSTVGSCLTLTVTDSYGDGMTAFNSTLPVPGVEFVTADGTVLKDKLDSDYYFISASPGTTASTRQIFASVDLTSGLEDQDFVQNLSVYPNPVSDVLNIDMSIKAGTEYEVFISDIMGSTVSKVAKNTNFLNVSTLSSGMYFINVKTASGVYAHKFTKI